MMINELKVFYKGDKGLMTFCNKKTVFQHREERENVKEGLGVIVDGSLFDKGNYAFAIFKNVATVVPKNYDNIEFFNNRGVPLKIEKGVYGDNVFLKETYKDRTYIRAYKEDGSVGLYESKTIKNADYEGPNVYFNRLEDVIVNWDDITDEIVSKVFESVASLSCTADLKDEMVVSALKGLGNNTIYRLSNGIIIADGKFESLIIWGEPENVKMCWLGRKYDLTNADYEDITSKIVDIIG